MRKYTAGSKEVIERTNSILKEIDCNDKYCALAFEVAEANSKNKDIQEEIEKANEAFQKASTDALQKEVDAHNKELREKKESSTTKTETKPTTTYRGTKIEGPKPTIERDEEGCLEGYRYRGKYIRRDEHNKGSFDYFSCSFKFNRGSNLKNLWHRSYFPTLSEALIAIDAHKKSS